MKPTYEISFNYMPHYIDKFMATVEIVFGEVLPSSLQSGNEKVFNYAMTLHSTYDDDFGDYRIRKNFYGDSWEEVTKAAKEGLFDAIEELTKISRRNFDAKKAIPDPIQGEIGGLYLD